MISIFDVDHFTSDLAHLCCIAHRSVLRKFGDPVNGSRVLRLGVVLRVHVLSHGRAADDVEGAVGDAWGHVRSL